MTTVKLSDAERDAVLAGLRLYQLLVADGGSLSHCALEDIRAIAADSGEPLDGEAVEDLCERLNT